MVAQPASTEQRNPIEGLIGTVKRWRRLGLFGVLGYFPLLMTFFLGSDNIYGYTMHDVAYGGTHAKEINVKFGTTLLNEQPREVRSTNGTSSYRSEDVDLRTLFIRNNGSHRIVNPNDVRLILCPLPLYFIIPNYDFGVSRESPLDDQCGSIWNARAIRPGETARIYYVANDPPDIVEDPKSSSNLTSGERTLDLQLAVRGFMFVAACILILSTSSFVADFITRAFLYVLNRPFKSKFQQGRVLRIIAFAIAIPALGIVLFWPILALSEYELAGDYDKLPGVLLPQMQLVTPPQPMSELVAIALKSGRYDEAFTSEKSIVGETERAETESIGKPGLVTARALGSLAWTALLAKKYEDALSAAERGLSLAPQELWIETNRAHALLLLGRVQEARDIYVGKRGTRVWGKVLWEDAVRDDFNTLERVPIETPLFSEMEASMGKN